LKVIYLNLEFTIHLEQDNIMIKYANSLQQIKNAEIRYIISIGKRQPMHVGHKKSLERIIAIKEIKLIYVIGSANVGGDPLFDPFVNPLTVDQQIEQFRRVFPGKEVIFLPILDVADMSKWGPSIVCSLKEMGVRPKECAMHFIGKSEDKLTRATSFALPNGEVATLNAGQWLVEAMGYYGFTIWFDDEMEVDLSISARNLRKLDLDEISADRQLLAAPEYLLELAINARKTNGCDGPLTLEDLSVDRIRKEL
jgi:hypothetical protein